MEDSCKRRRSRVTQTSVNIELVTRRTFGQRAADGFTNAFGNWTYIYAAPLILMATNRSSRRDRLTLENDAQETAMILEIQDRQIELLEGIKAETAILRQLIAGKQDAVPAQSRLAEGSATSCSRVLN